MYKPSLEDVVRLSEHGNLIPVYRELPADLETPVSVYLKLRGQGPSFLLESVERGEQVGRYSFLGANPQHSLIADGQPLVPPNVGGAEGLVSSVPPKGGGAGGQVRLHHHGESQVVDLAGRDPLDVLKAMLGRYHTVSVPGLPRFTGGAVGYMSYDLVRFFERLPNTAIDNLGLPLCHFLLTDSLVIFDHVKQRMVVVAHAYVNGDVKAAYDSAVARIESLVARIRQPLTLPGMPAWRIENQLLPNVTRVEFEARVRAAQEYIAAGDIFQVVLSQRFQRQTAADPFAIYRALRQINPSPYMFFLDLGDVRLIGSSPEMLVRLQNGTAEVRPIAGTRQRGANEAEDRALEAELLADPKERAEHVMLVDLGRNDLGRVCRYGSVHVPVLMTIERYSHVMHIVSSVQGQLNGNHDAFDLLRATFPAGTLTGAPKIRAMEIIEELEGVRRGPYGGAVGYFGYGGAMDTCITIRTIVMRGTTAYIQAGAGIVADSDPGREYEECVNKARALSEAINIAERGML